MTSTKTPQIFLDIAKQDLKSSQLLFENECYPQSVFFFQQSIEKAVKSIAIWLELTTIKKASKKIRHQGMKLFEITNNKWQSDINKMKTNEEMTEVVSNVLGFGHVEDVLVEAEEKAEEAYNLVKTYLQNKEFVEISQDDATKLLNEIYKSKNEYRIELEARTDFFETDDDWREYVNEIALMLNQIVEYYSDEFTKQDMPIPENITEQVENEFNHVLKVSGKESWNTLATTIVDINFITKTLFYLCIFADPHAISARYPDEDFNPIDFYALKLPFVSKLPEITDITEKLLELLDSVYTRVQDAELKHLTLEMETQKVN